MDLTAQEKALVNQWQKGFPLSARPYADIARQMGLEEQKVLDMLSELKDKGVLSRVGAVVRPNTVGRSCLVAMEVPRHDLDRVADTICQEPCVNHNYERENSLNLWFVVTASCPKTLDHVLSRIERKTGYKTVRLPLKKAYHIDLGFCL